MTTTTAAASSARYPGGLQQLVERCVGAGDAAQGVDEPDGVDAGHQGHRGHDEQPGQAVGTAMDAQANQDGDDRHHGRRDDEPAAQHAAAGEERQRDGRQRNGEQQRAGGVPEPPALHAASCPSVGVHHACRPRPRGIA
jgi:hypothetical protein